LGAALPAEGGEERDEAVDGVEGGREWDAPGSECADGGPVYDVGS
jgi:hypothetical protein